jgi:elongation factor Ts
VEITTQMVKDLRAATNAGVLDCRKALQSTDGDFDRALAILKEKGLLTAAKKADRVANEGLIGSYVHTGSKVGAMVEVACESDFVARTDQFQTLVRDLAMQVVATKPQWVRIEDVPAEVVASETESAKVALGETDKPAEIVKKIIDGKLAKFYEENCLMEQPFIKDGGVLVKDLVTQTIAKMGENIQVRRFARLEVGG